MPTSGTQGFTLDLNSIVEEAFERCGASLTSGYDLRTARRSLNLLLIEWGNRGINLWTVEQTTIPLHKGSSVYLLPMGMVDIFDCVIRSAQAGVPSDRVLSRLSAANYIAIPNKASVGTPTQVWIDRKTGTEARTQVRTSADVDETDRTIPITITSGLPPYGVVRIGDEVLTYSGIVGGMLFGCVRGPNAAPHSAGESVYIVRVPTATVWPVPSAQASGSHLVVWYLRRMDDVGTGSSEQDVPYRFIPALVSGLAFYLSAKIPGVAADRAMLLKQDYEEQWAMAATEDREKATLRIVPHVWGV